MKIRHNPSETRIKSRHHATGFGYLGQQWDQILIGTASWADKSLVDSGKFYPADVKSPEGRLRFYASRFPLVEVDASFYAIPEARAAMQWVERTPAPFVFDVKAFRLLTGHQTPSAMLPKDIREALGEIGKKHVYYRDLPPEIAEEVWKRFRAGIGPLREAGKLGVVLFQFAPWFVYGKTSYAHIRDAREMLPGYRIAVEFRNKSWLDAKHRDKVLAFEREHGLTHVIVDEPQGFASSVPQVWEATSPEIAIVRLHGRNRATWEAKGLPSSAERFEYLYSDAELAEFADPLRALSSKVEAVHVLFNNCYTDYATRNAMSLTHLLAKA